MGLTVAGGAGITTGMQGRSKRGASGGDATPGLFDEPPAAPSGAEGEAPGEGTQESSPSRKPGGPRGASRKASDTPADSAEATRAKPTSAPAPAEEPPVLSVSGLTQAIADRLGGLGKFAVEGEVSSLRTPASGHVYFDLKDQGARISCVVWRSQVRRVMKTPLEEGAQVVIHGRLDVYAPRGSYSLIVDRLEPVGLGALLAQLEELKVELRGLGWFDRARPLPAMPRCIGVVTSRDGAALRDFLRTRTLRWAGYPVRLAHAPVQGPGAAAEIAEAIARLDESGVDVIVVCRGGGSLEDLWAFNERPVAEAIHRAGVPVVSGVGHESDVTLADLVADLRAHTPTDAAQTVIPDRAALEAALQRQANYLVAAMDELLVDAGARLGELAVRPALRDPARILGERGRLLAGLGARAQRAATARAREADGRLRTSLARLERWSPRARIERWSRRLAAAGSALERRGELTLADAQGRLGLAARSLEATSPLAVLGRGYSLTRRPQDGAAVRDASDLEPGDELETRLARGSVRSRVTSVEPAPPDGSGPAAEAEDER